MTDYEVEKIIKEMELWKKYGKRDGNYNGLISDIDLSHILKDYCRQT